ncbi:hypothetical protein, partial [Escherichia coli]|uniref:hypothetical protein n=1 Tax=Escherichia coli TaxID=562 RepID=UPI001BC858E2
MKAKREMFMGQTLPAATRDEALDARPAIERGGTAGPPNRSSRATRHDGALQKPRFKLRAGSVRDSFARSRACRSETTTAGPRGGR